MKYSEIGSEFWENTVLEEKEYPKIECGNRRRDFLCGRTALDYVVHDAKKCYDWKSVLLPSYCCDTMIAPFLKNGIKVRFYTVKSSENGLSYKLPKPQPGEAIYVMRYFGFAQNMDGLTDVINEWDFCMLDDTHSCFMQTTELENVKNIAYVYASYRKWANIPGFAVAKKLKSDFCLPAPVLVNEEYVNCRTAACIQKENYMNCGQGDKASFLHLYQEAEEILETQYENFAAAPEAICAYQNLDVENMRKIRRKNAAYLIRELKKQKKLRLLFDNLEEGDCPLFVPILTEGKYRDKLKRHLIENSIYCPVHWPVTNLHGKLEKEAAELYEKELSLICDQRYGLEEMNRIVTVINEFFKNI